jgi:ketosteroid isomerase-like protein
MSEKNVETVRRVYEGVNARLEIPRELFDPDYEFDRTAAEVWNQFFHIWTLRDGRIVRLSIHTDRNRSLEAAGLSE